MDQMGKRSSEGGWMEVRLALEVQHSRQGGIPDVPSNGSNNNTENNNPGRTRSAKSKLTSDAMTERRKRERCRRESAKHDPQRISQM